MTNIDKNNAKLSPQTVSPVKRSFFMGFKPKPCSTCGAKFQPSWSKARNCSAACAIAERAVDDPITGCWVIPPTPGLKYCSISYAGEQDYGHRFSYSHLNGPIPAGMFVRHTCDNPPCVNPDHLKLGSHDDNMADMVDRGRSAKGTANSQAKLSEPQVLEIYSTIADRKSVAAMYQISIANVRSIQNGKSWAHLTQHKGDAK